MGYDFPDWREHEVKFKKAQVAELTFIIETLEKQIPKKPIFTNAFESVFIYMEMFRLQQKR